MDVCVYYYVLMYYGVRPAFVKRCANNRLSAQRTRPNNDYREYLGNTKSLAICNQYVPVCKANQRV